MIEINTEKQTPIANIVLAKTRMYFFIILKVLSILQKNERGITYYLNTLRRVHVINLSIVINHRKYK